MSYPVPEMIERLESLKERIRELEREHGRAPGSVSLLAVSKRHPPESINALFEHGHLDFGENYIQEAVSKAESLPDDIRWHFIGSLQRNKARHVPGVFSLFHCLHSVKLAQTLQNKCEAMELNQDVLIQVNIGCESQKSGCNAKDLDTLVEHVLDCPRLVLKGLMCIPPVSDPEDARSYFARLRTLRDSLETRFSLSLPQLSMGMSGDFEQAIAEGSTMVRVGTAIFGHRPS